MGWMGLDRTGGRAPSLRFGALVWLARYQKEPRQARHSQQPGVIDWLADTYICICIMLAALGNYTGPREVLAAAMAPSTTPWPAGIWAVHRGSQQSGPAALTRFAARIASQ